MRVVAFLLLLAYLLLVGWLALRPLSVLWVPPDNLEPFARISAAIERGPQDAVRIIGLAMLRLAPLGVLLPLLGSRLGGSRFGSLCRTVCCGGLIALVLEWLQLMVPSRVADVDTIILSALGVAVTHLLCYGRLRAWAFRDAPSGSRPGRRPIALHQHATDDAHDAPRRPRRRRRAEVRAPAMSRRS